MGPMEDYRADTYGESFADVYDDWYDGVSDARAVARFVADRCAGGPVLELGVGTGRLAAPLVAAGVAVVGLDASGSMLARCARRVGPGSGPALVRADMAALPFGPGPRFGAVLIGFNTLFNLPREADQAAAMAQAAALLTPEGRLVVEANQTEVLAGGPPTWIGTGSLDPVARRLTVLATVLDRDDQRIRGHHIELSDAGVRFRPWQLRWATTAQIDGYAAAAGLVLAERHGGWDGAPFEPGGDLNISVYARATGSVGAGENPPTAAS